jgi:hypothetical protein
MSFLAGRQAGLSCRPPWREVLVGQLAGRRRRTPSWPYFSAAWPSFGLWLDVLLGRLVGGLSFVIRAAVLVSRYEDRLGVSLCMLQ